MAESILADATQTSAMADREVYMTRCSCVLLIVGCVLGAFGCASDNTVAVSQPSLADQGWTWLGVAKVKADDNQDLLATGQLPSTYESICLQSDGPAEIRRLAVIFPDGSTFLPEQGTKFDGPGIKTIIIPGGKRKIEKVVLVHAGARPVLPTTINVWVK
jgi:hypothetical protein